MSKCSSVQWVQRDTACACALLRYSVLRCATDQEVPLGGGRVHDCPKYQPVLGATTQPHTQKKWPWGSDEGERSQEMHVPTPGWFITFWLECAGDDGVSVPCSFPLRVPGKPVNEPGDHCRVGAQLVSGDCVNRARSVFHTHTHTHIHTHTHTHTHIHTRTRRADIFTGHHRLNRNDIPTPDEPPTKSRRAMTVTWKS